MKKIRIYLLVVLLITSITGCKDWLDVNQNPNSLTSSTKDLVLVGAEKQFAERQQVSPGFSLLGAWIGYYGHSGGWSGWNNVKSYNMTSSDYNDMFNAPYLNELKNLGYVEDRGWEEENVAYVGVARIMRTALFQRLVDTYGDIPYFDAVKGFEGNTQPVYDDAQAIYDNLVVQLDTAILLLNQAIENSKALEAKYDIIAGGNLTLWKQYANTLKLRVLLRQSEVASRQSYITSNLKFDNAGFIQSSVTANPGYIAGQDGKLNPVYGYGRDYKGTLTSANQQYGLNIFLLSMYKANYDTRLEYCWEPGVVSKNYNWGLQLGQNGAPEDHWNNSSVRMASGIYGDGTDDAVVMSIMEADFLIAEALARGYNLSAAGVSSSAEEMFNLGIEESFYYYGQRAGATTIAADYEEYMTNLSGDAAWNSASPVKSIIYQKYIAGVGVYHDETWADYRRTGYPVAGNPSEIDNSMISYYFNIVRDQVPVRMLYVQRELDLNDVNVNAAISKTGVTYDSKFIMDAKIFWDVK